MTFSARTRHLLLSFAILVAGVIELWLGKQLVVIAICVGTFLLFGNFMIYATGSKERKMRKQQRYDYYAGKS
jgi:hypothetical protein